MKIFERFASRKLLVFNLVLLGIFVGFSLAFFSFSCSTPQPTRTAHAENGPVLSVPADALAVAESIQTAFNTVSARLLPSIVEIKTVEVTRQQMPDLGNSPWKFFFDVPEGGQEREFRSQGLGSGIIVRQVNNTWYIITNDHVVGNATEIVVVVDDGREFEAKLVGKDPRKDLALVSFESSEKFPVASLGDSDSVKVGDWAIAIGNPLGLVSSVTMGIISAVGRSGGPGGNISDFLQTDAAINRGNSGGALVNIRGEVVGINTWIASETGGSDGLGFAIPINNAKRAIDEFINSGKVTYGWLGVSLLEANKEMAEDLGVTEYRGALATQVFLGSPAEKGGLRPGDFITAVNGREVRDQQHLVRVVGDLMAGEKAVFTVVRDRKRIEITVTIEERRDDIAAENSKLWPGLMVLPLTDTIREAAKLDASVQGLFVAEVVAKSPAAVMGVQRGDVIKAVNGIEVKDLASFYRVIGERTGKELWFEFVREERELESVKFKRK
jgi:Do/DeqQ family serine protease